MSGAPLVYDEQGRALCTATTRGGARCTGPAMRGQRVCRMHGGASGQARASAQARLAQMVEPALGTILRVLASPTASDHAKLRAAENVLDRGGFPRRAEVSTDAGEARAELIERILTFREQAAPAELGQLTATETEATS